MTGTALRVEVDSADAVRRAVVAARAAGKSLVLESPPGAAGWQGIGWWRELVALARAEAPELDIVAVLDCGEAPGLALAALKAGCGRVRVVADGAALAALVALAPGLGGEVLAC